MDAPGIMDLLEGLEFKNTLLIEQSDQRLPDTSGTAHFLGKIIKQA